MEETRSKAKADVAELQNQVRAMTCSSVVGKMHVKVSSFMHDHSALIIWQMAAAEKAAAEKAAELEAAHDAALKSMLVQAHAMHCLNGFQIYCTLHATMYS